MNAIQMNYVSLVITIDGKLFATAAFPTIRSAKRYSTMIKNHLQRKAAKRDGIDLRHIDALRWSHKPGRQLTAVSCEYEFVHFTLSR